MRCISVALTKISQDACAQSPPGPATWCSHLLKMTAGARHPGVGGFDHALALPDLVTAPSLREGANQSHFLLRGRQRTHPLVAHLAKIVIGKEYWLYSHD
jgi:hypothetical protein